MTAASGAHEKFQLRGGLDTFGDDLDAKFSREADRRSDDGRAAMIVRQAVHKLLRDLDSADTIVEQIFERGIAGAEVVDRNSHAERPQPVDDVAIAAARFHEQRFGQFEFELSGIQSIGAQSLHEIAQKVGRRNQLGRGQIDGGDRRTDPSMSQTASAGGPRQAPIAQLGRSSLSSRRSG